jgi:TolB protein
MSFDGLWIVLTACLMIALDAPQAPASLDPFTDHGDIGLASSPGAGSVVSGIDGKSLSVSGGGANIWASHDDFQYVWKKASGDVTLAANVEFAAPTPGVIAHRKAVIMIRQSLDPDSAYADACEHGNGMTALQWRDEKGAVSYEVQANADAPKRLRIEKRGDYFSMSIGDSDADLHPTGGACKVVLHGDYYIGVGICSHSKTRIETATFSDIVIGTPPSGGKPMMISTLQTYQLGNNHDRKVVYVQTQAGDRRFEAPNWSRDKSNTLYFNNNGHLFKVSAVLPTSDPTSVDVNCQQVDLGILTRLNNDHALSFDGTMLGVSDQSQGNRKSTVWTIPLAGGEPTQITRNTPSYLHGWSPDGKTLVFAGEREGKWDIYCIPSGGGEETRLTSSPGRCDGPEYSPDGQYVYFNSDRTGLMQIWRMRPDGSDQEQVTHDQTNDWFPHISPDGRQMVFISFDTTVASGDHPASKDVVIRLMNLRTGVVTDAATLFGGQGTINVASWSPDSHYFGFVSYQIVSQ